MAKNAKFAILHPLPPPRPREKKNQSAMRLVIQRVTQASVEVAPDYLASIASGIMVLVGVECGDTEADALYLARKTADLRIFDDPDGVMNLSLIDTSGEVLAISQFTLLAATRKGNRPSYTRAARPHEAESLYNLYCDLLRQSGLCVRQGIFGADMKVSLVNNGPVTIVIDSRNPI